MAEIVSSLHTKFYEDSNRDKGKITSSRIGCGLRNRECIIEATN